MSEMTTKGRTQAWTFAIAGGAAIVGGPLLAMVSGAPTPIFSALTFGAAIGVLDTIGVEDTSEVTIKSAAGLTLGGLMALALFVHESLILGGLVLGVGIVSTRWIWWRAEERDYLAAVMAITMGAAGVWLAEIFVGPSSQFSGGVYIQPLLWGIFAGLASIALEGPRRRFADTRRRAPARLTGVDGDLGRADEAQQNAGYLEEERIYDDVVATLEGSAEDERIRASARAAVDACREVDAQRRIIAGFNPEAQREQVEARIEKLRSRAKATSRSSEEVDFALSELEEERAQCEKMMDHALALEARQERLRSALERLRLDTIQRRCDGLYEAQVSTSLSTLNELVDSSVTEREIFHELAEGSRE